jgi:hypothetical protein
MYPPDPGGKFNIEHIFLGKKFNEDPDPASSKKQAHGMCISKKY